MTDDACDARHGGARRHYTFLCAVTAGARRPAVERPVMPALMRRPPQLRAFDGVCFLCAGPSHSQNYCWLRHCTLCQGWGHSHSACLLAPPESAVAYEPRHEMRYDPYGLTSHAPRRSQLTYPDAFEIPE